MSPKKTYQGTWNYAGSIIRQRGDRYQVESNHGGVRQRHTEDSLKAAKAYARQKSIEIKNEGVTAFSLSHIQKVDAAQAFNLLPPGATLKLIVRDYLQAQDKLTGVPLQNAVDYFVRHNNPQGGIKTVSELLTGYIAVKEKGNRRQRTITDVRTRIGKFAKEWGAQPVHAITSKDIEAWMDRGQFKGQNRINYLRVLHGFFNYARKQKLIEHNPADRDAIERPACDERLPEIYTYSQVQSMLSAADKAFVPYMAIGFFAGVRPSELEGLDWGDVDFESNLITVRPAVAKMRRQRFIEMSANLTAWLLPYRRKSGRIVPAEKSIIRYRRQLVIKTKIPWIPDGMRHTFASNYLAHANDINKTMMQLGHTGRPDMLFRHYRNLVKPADAAKYWEIRPAQADNLVQLPAVG